MFAAGPPLSNIHNVPALWEGAGTTGAAPCVPRSAKFMRPGSDNVELRVARSSRNPYDVLGVTPEASQDEIKSAYRRMAMKYHPDRNPGDEEAEEQFKLVSEAYATLRDPESRARFDRYGSAGGTPDFNTVDWQSVFNEADIKIDWDMRGGFPKTGNAMFDMLFGAMAGMMRSSGLLPGEDRDVQVRVPVDLVRTGGSVRVRVPGPSVCPSCRGSGVTGGSACPTCGSRGVVRSGASVDVDVPAGIRSGQKLRLKGLGGPGNPPGDVFVELGVELPEGVELRGRDLVANLYLTPLETRLGTRTTVAGVSVEIPSGSREGESIRVPQGGLGGDLIVTVRENVWRGLRRLAGDLWRKATTGSAPLVAKE